jgi:signal transduction histidine kinase
MLRFQSAMERIPSSQPARELMEKALDHADEVIAEGRDRVTQLRTLQHAGDLPSALQHIGEELGREEKVAFRLTVEGVRRPLDAAASDEVQRIVHEALVNAFRHAHARQIDVGVTYTGRSLAISVVDDGQGFDVATVVKHGPAGHWGLKGMHERAANLHSQLVLSSRDGAGTAVELTVPAAIAFRRAPGKWNRWLNLLRATFGAQRNAARSAHDDPQVK